MWIPAEKEGEADNHESSHCVPHLVKGAPEFRLVHHLLSTQDLVGYRLAHIVLSNARDSSVEGLVLRELFDWLIVGKLEVVELLVL